MGIAFSKETFVEIQIASIAIQIAALKITTLPRSKKNARILHRIDITVITKRYENIILFLFSFFLLLSVNDFGIPITIRHFPYE